MSGESLLVVKDSFNPPSLVLKVTMSHYMLASSSLVMLPYICYPSICKSQQLGNEVERQGKAKQTSQLRLDSNPRHSAV